VARVGTTDTITTFTANPRIHASPTTQRNIIVLEITKGSPNYTLTTIYYSGVANVFDFTELHALGTMEPDSMATANGYLNGLSASSFNVTAPLSVAVNEGLNGDLNAFVFGWNQTNPVMHFSDIIYKVIA
jgi:hypothetical protein